MPSRMMSARAGAGGAGEVSVADSPLATFESLTQAAVIGVMGVAIVVSNLLIIAAFLNFKGLSNEVINYYLLSLAVADLLCGLFVVPLSVYPAITGRWMFGDLMCRLAGYVEVTLWSVSVYTFMWISVDRYLAVRKPLRYETVSATVQTRTRSQCWMVFTWISAAMLCCPPLLGYKKEANFDKETFICMLDWGTTYAYTATLGILVLGPSVISIVYNYFYIFSMKRKLNSGAPIHDKEYATALAENLANPSHWMSFVLVCAFWLSWAPYAGVRLYEYITDQELKIPMLHFGVVWLGILNSFWKIVILISLSPQFRLALRILCLTACCRTKGRLQAELIGMDNDD
ncbi:G-protein coupled receptor 52 isoform X1 [Plodia interpunctella]|uniref:G-protein coupled receptor 52 isoform X1 n=1 Tax=Plodia interpunctella TaxID=58824 RepID=UPI002367AB50|nr:G-protein coupled receptor 52 isoform X1 [Plodia interpunctella]XP_053624361.1 G-protein coupled receptor 52 isoform X1 [Plodia interpunctella]XP_053624362.1 G-protein coupled receptor 52 isoform X1 [Plodia interpunctella]XP_053624363.1 G-protein coupled receptor 52 isoform X1 [Plodia interpunctella]XP_053624364.1 G-protein coupled receptor 52 isoform X1 [Plodia interpunctella]XP_053624365.1 G-protein coupled receptor 52 isoform X1 [Plodia interpunctella]